MKSGPPLQAGLRVLLIDDHTLFRSGLAELLTRRQVEVTAAVGDGVEGCRLAEIQCPDIVLLDLRMPGLSGLATLERLVKVASASVVVLTTSDDDQDLLHALRAGAKGYLLKDMEPEQLIESLARIAAGETVVAPEMTGALARVVQNEPGKKEIPSGLADLTPRETEILSHLAEGQSNKVIARELGISDGTVKLHVRAILRKLKVRSRVEAAVFAVEQGLGYRSKGSS